MRTRPRAFHSRPCHLANTPTIGGRQKINERNYRVTDKTKRVDHAGINRLVLQLHTHRLYCLSYGMARNMVTMMSGWVL